jgi:sortase (surface protein transpeptidase)
MPAGRYVLSTSLLFLSLVMIGLSLDLVLFSRIEYRTSQTRAFARFREELALGVAPTGQVDAHGRLLAPGTPVAELDVKRLGLSAVVLEGTTSAVTMSGPGHLRDTVLPGEHGTSVIFGRASAYGGPFGSISRLRPGDPITVTTGIGTSQFKVIDVRHAGDPLPPPLASDGARLTLVSATGLPFVPAGIVSVDADTVGKAQPGTQLVLGSVSRPELALATDTSNLWTLVFWLQALVLLTIGVVWSWRSLGHARTWVIFAPVLALIVFFVTRQLTQLLPNLT